MNNMAFMRLVILLAAGIALAQASSAAAQGSDPCGGHQLLPKPRAEGSCLTLKPEVFPSPDRSLRAVVLPVGLELHATPDIESRVAIRANDAKLLTSKDHASPRGADGFYVVRAKWSPDSQFFVYSMSSSGGHSPLLFPTWVYSRQKNLFVSFSELIGGRPTLSEDFSFSGPHTVKATTWDKAGSDKHVPVVVDLEEAIGKMPPAAEK
jgi:hypothetical protein